MMRKIGRDGAKARTRQWRPSLLAAVAAMATLFGAPFGFFESVAHAQLGLNAPPVGPPGKQGAKASKAAPAGPESHAASGEDGQKLDSQEPSLPQDPLKVPTAVRDRIGTDIDPEYEHGRGPQTERDFYGLYYAERSNSYRFRTIFPLWAERTQPNDRASIFGPFYFNRRSTNVDADVLFPWFWRLREKDTRTTIVGPLLHRESDGSKGSTPRHDNWLAPLYFEGSAADDSGYFHIPPLLTFTKHSSHDGLNIVGPLFCSWKGGSSCDSRTADDIDLGLAPFYFYGHSEGSEYEIVPPLLHYYKYSEIGDRSTNLWGPLLWQKSRKGSVFNAMPIYWHNWGPNEDHTTLFPFFHYGYKGTSNLLVTPLFVKSRGEQGESAFATWGYARYRGRTELDMWTPLFWWFRDPDINLDRKLLFPFFYSNTSPRSNDLALVPFYAHFEHPAISESWWVTPLFHHSRSLTGWETDILPIFFMGRENQSTHLVAAPLLFDFASPRSRATVVPPVYFRFENPESISQLALNTYYFEKKHAQGKEWEFHFFPAFSYGESPNGHFWNLFYGLAGYTRDGSTTKMRAFYIPITLSP